MLNFLIILAIFVAVIIGYKTGFNTGFFAIVFAYLIGGFVMGMTPKDIIGGWPLCFLLHFSNSFLEADKMLTMKLPLRNRKLILHCRRKICT